MNPLTAFGNDNVLGNCFYNFKFSALTRSVPFLKILRIRHQSSANMHVICFQKWNGVAQLKPEQNHVIFHNDSFKIKLKMLTCICYMWIGTFLKKPRFNFESEAHLYLSLAWIFSTSSNNVIKPAFCHVTVWRNDWLNCCLIVFYTK